MARRRSGVLSFVARQLSGQPRSVQLRAAAQHSADAAAAARVPARFLVVAGAAPFVVAGGEGSR